MKFLVGLTIWKTTFPFPNYPTFLVPSPSTLLPCPFRSSLYSSFPLKLPSQPSLPLRFFLPFPSSGSRGGGSILYNFDLNFTLGCGTSLPPCFPLDTGLDLLWFKDWLGLDWMTGGIGFVWLVVPRVGLVWVGGGAGFWWGEENEFAAGISSSLDLLFPALFFHFLT